MDQVSERKKVRALYQPPPAEDPSKNYCRLTVVILISLVFIAGEVIGGKLAGSIAIISDAIHLVSDLIGFIFSFIFLYLSRKVMDEKVSFGYHRMQLLGALANLFIVWILVIFIIYEATLRIFNHQFVQNPTIMLITAAAGLVINMLMYAILHGGDSHSHGLLAQDCDHDHSHNHNHQQDSQDCSQLCGDQICMKTVKEVHCHKGKDKSVHRHGDQRKYSQDVHVHRQNSHHQECKSQPQQEICKKSHEHQPTCYLKPNTKGKHQHQHICNGHHDHVVEQKEHKHKTHDHNHQGHDHHDHQGHNHQGHNHQGHDHQGHDHHDGQSKHITRQSIGMQAALLHALSDVVQSVGVLLSALVIYYFGSDHGSQVFQWNKWHLFDPISTYIFSALSLFSTFPIIKNCYYLIMQSTPEYFDLDDIRQQFQQIQGVIDVHDIHVWDLKPGKTIIIAHVLTKKGTERSVLTRLTDLCRQKRIYHSTFQVEQQDFKNDQDYILCHHDIH